jgi:hypothetical protein
MSRASGSSFGSHALSDAISMQSSSPAQDNAAASSSQISTPTPPRISSPRLLSFQDAVPWIPFAPLDNTSVDRLSFDAKDDNVEPTRSCTRAAELSNSVSGEREPQGLRSCAPRPPLWRRLPMTCPSCPNIPKLEEAPLLAPLPQLHEATSVESRHSAPGAPEAARANLLGAASTPSRLSGDTAAPAPSTRGVDEALGAMVLLPLEISASQLFAPSGWSARDLQPALAGGLPGGGGSVASSSEMHAPWTKRLSLDETWRVRRPSLLSTVCNICVCL